MSETVALPELDVKALPPCFSTEVEKAKAAIMWPDPIDAAATLQTLRCRVAHQPLLHPWSSLLLSRRIT